MADFFRQGKISVLTHPRKTVLLARFPKAEAVLTRVSPSICRRRCSPEGTRGAANQVIRLNTGMITIPGEPEAPYRELPDEAFVRIETYSDILDATRLLLAGTQVAFEPITGSISGFLRPTPVTVTRKVSVNYPRAQTGRTAETILVKDTPGSLVRALGEVLAVKSPLAELRIDCAFIEPGSRAREVADAFEGITRLMNYRAERLFCRTDIVDLMGWIGTLSPARLDAQMVYGDPEWGDFVRREPFGHLVENHPAPDLERHTRTLVCYAKPDRDDLQAVLSHMAASGKSIGIANGAEAMRRAPHFRGMSPSKALLLGNHCLAKTGVLDVSGMAQEQSWGAAHEAGRALYQETEKAVLGCLQEVWTDQWSFHRPISIQVEGWRDASDLANIRNHALDGAFKAAQKLEGPYPFGIASLDLGGLTGNAVGQLTKQSGFGSVVDHAAAATISVGTFETAAVCDWLLANWQRFVGATFKHV